MSDLPARNIESFNPCSLTLKGFFVDSGFITLLIPFHEVLSQRENPPGTMKINADPLGAL
jgi:hypothetical protein